MFKEYVLYYAAGQLKLQPTDANICWTLNSNRKIIEWIKNRGVSEQLHIKYQKKAVRTQLRDWDPEQARNVLENLFLYAPKTRTWKSSNQHQSRLFSRYHPHHHDPQQGEQSGYWAQSQSRSSWRGRSERETPYYRHHEQGPEPKGHPPPKPVPTQAASNQVSPPGFGQLHALDSSKTYGLASAELALIHAQISKLKSLASAYWRNLGEPHSKAKLCNREPN